MAFRSARETPNGYTLVNEDISSDHIEAVYALEKTGWEFPWTPRTQARFCDAQGVNVAQNMCSYFSHCYVISNNVDFNDLEPPLRNAVIDAGQYYAKPPTRRRCNKTRKHYRRNTGATTEKSTKQSNFD